MCDDHFLAIFYKWASCGYAVTLFKIISVLLGIFRQFWLQFKKQLLPAN